MKFKKPMTLTAALLFGLSLAACQQSSGDDDDLLGISLLAGVAAASNVPQLEGFCHFSFGSRTVYNVPITTMDSAKTESLTFTSSTTRRWSAVYVPGAADGTVVTFDFNPAYRPPFGYNEDISLVHVTGGCPLESSTSDYNVNSSSTAPQTPVNYSFGSNTFTFNSSAQGKNFFIIAAPELTQTTGSTTRTDP